MKEVLWIREKGERISFADVNRYPEPYGDAGCGDSAVRKLICYFGYGFSERSFNG